MLPTYPMEVWLCAIFAVLFMGVSKAGFGGGIGLIATPLLALVLPVGVAAALMLPLLIACDVFAVRHYIRCFDIQIVMRLLPGAFLGIGIGTVFFGYFSQHERVLQVGLGLLAFSFVLFQVVRDFVIGSVEQRKSSMVEGFLMGTLSGFTSTIAHAGGPPVVIYLIRQKLSRTRFVGTTVIFFSILNLVKVPPYWMLGLFNADIFKLTVILSPLAFLGVRFGIFLNNRFSDFWFNRVIYGILFLTALQLIFNFNFFNLLF